MQWKISAYMLPIASENILRGNFAESFRLLSFGSIGFVLFLFSIILYFSPFSRKFLLFIGISAIGLCILFLLRFSILNPIWLSNISFQQEQFNNIRIFSTNIMDHSNLSQDSAIRIGYNTVFDRLFFCFHWISIGFYACLFGGIILIGSSRKYYNGKFALVCTIFTTIMLASLLALSSDAIMSEYYLNRADKVLSLGLSQEASDYLEKAKESNPNVIYTLNYFYRLGYTDYLNKIDSAAVHFFRGKNLQRAKSFQHALKEYAGAENDDSIRDVLVKEKVRLYANDGLDRYKEDQKYKAISRFIDSTLMVPQQSESHFFLSSIYLETHRYNQYPALLETQSLLSVCHEKLTRADAQNIMGDAGYKSLDFARGRDAYDKSRGSFSLIRRIVNFYGMKGLQGL
jgi:hypothetical protein